MDDLSTQDLIRTHTSAVVPLLIRELEAQGGINGMHLSCVSGHAHILAERGDVLMYGVKGETRHLMSVLCECLAVLAFVPGGVRFSGQHFVGMPSLEPDEMAEVQEIQEVLEGVGV